MRPSEATPQAGRPSPQTSDAVASSPNRFLIFSVVSAALLMAAIDQTIVATAIPSIQHDLHARINWSGWTLTIYALGQVITMPVAGRLSDQLGRKTIFLGATILFTTASLACGLANSIGLLIILRAVQAIGGGAFMPSASGIVADHFGPDRDRALAMFTSILPIGGIVGPVLGGVFVTFWSWRGIFLVNVPLGIVLAVLCVKVIPRGNLRPSAPIDWRGVLLLGAMILSIMFGFSLLGTGSTSITSWRFFVPELVGVIAGWQFLRHSRHHEAPFFPPRLLYGRGFGVVNFINLVHGAAVLGLAALVPLYAEQRFGISILDASTLLTARAVGMIAVAGLASMALRRTGVRRPMAAGFSAMALGLVMLAWVPASIRPYDWLAIAAGVTGIGMGLAVPASNNATLQLAPKDIAAIAGLRGMFRQSGSILSLSVMTSLMARSSDPGLLQARGFLVLAVLLVGLLFLIRMVPDHRGRW